MIYKYNSKIFDDEKGVEAFVFLWNAILQMLSTEFALLYEWKASNEISQVEYFHVSAQNLMLLTLAFDVCHMVLTFLS